MKTSESSDIKFSLWIPLISFACLPNTSFADEPGAPATVKELFANFDPRKDLLDTRVVRRWEKDGIVDRYVTG